MSYPSIWFQWNGMREKKTQQNKTSKLSRRTKEWGKRNKLKFGGTVSCFLHHDEWIKREWGEKVMKRLN